MTGFLRTGLVVLDGLLAPDDVAGVNDIVAGLWFEDQDLGRGVLARR